MRVVLGCLSAAEQEFEPIRPPLLRADFRAPHEIALAEHACRLARRVEHEEGADPSAQQRVERLRERRGFGNPDETEGHRFFHAHWVWLRTNFVADISRGALASAWLRANFFQGAQKGMSR